MVVQYISLLRLNDTKAWSVSTNISLNILHISVEGNKHMNLKIYQFIEQTQIFVKAFFVS